MGKFRMIRWGEGPTMECTECEEELTAETVGVAKRKAEEAVDKLKQENPLFEFGITKLIQIKDSGREVDIPLNIP